MDYFASPSDVGCKQTKDKHIFRECTFKLLPPGASLAQNALYISWIQGVHF